MASSDFERFVETFFGQGPEAARGGLDGAALARRTGDERDKAKAMLQERLGPADPRPAVGLGVLRDQGSAERIRALMQAHADRAEAVDAGFLVDTATALWRITQDPA